MKKASINIFRLLLMILIFYIIFGIIQSFVTLERDFIETLTYDTGDVLYNVIFWPKVLSTAGEFEGLTGTLMGAGISLGIAIVLVWFAFYIERIIMKKKEKEMKDEEIEKAHMKMMGIEEEEPGGSKSMIIVEKPKLNNKNGSKKTSKF